MNAKYHEQEAQIIAQAGRPGAVTIATNMAGRGTDIVLGGSLDTELRSVEDPTPEKMQLIRQRWKERHEAVVKSQEDFILSRLSVMSPVELIIS